MIQTEKYSSETVSSSLKLINEQVNKNKTDKFIFSKLDFLLEEVIYPISLHVVNFLVITEGKVTHCFDLLPKLFVLLHTSNSIIYINEEKGKKEIKTGYEWKKSLIQQLCESVWDPLKLHQIISTFKESKMSEDDMNIVVEKCIK